MDKGKERFHVETLKTKTFLFHFFFNKASQMPPDCRLLFSTKKDIS